MKTREAGPDLMKQLTPSPELAILCHLATRTHASADEIAAVFELPRAQARTFLIVLEAMRLVLGRQDLDSRAPRRVYAVTAEGRLKVEGDKGAPT